MTDRKLKTMLFVPATRPERIEKALASGAGAVIVDLEDAVPHGSKELAREALDNFLREHSGPGIYVRINGRGTDCFNDDIALCARHEKVVGIMLPKAESPDDIRALSHVGKPVIPLIESAKGLQSGWI